MQKSFFTIIYLSSMYYYFTIIYLLNTVIYYNKIFIEILYLFLLQLENYFTLIGGRDFKEIITNILKEILADNVVVEFSWDGRKKNVFVIYTYLRKL